MIRCFYLFYWCIFRFVEHCDNGSDAQHSPMYIHGLLQGMSFSELGSPFEFMEADSIVQRFSKPGLLIRNDKQPEHGAYNTTSMHIFVISRA